MSQRAPDIFVNRGQHVGAFAEMAGVNQKNATTKLLDRVHVVADEKHCSAFASYFVHLRQAFLLKVRIPDYQPYSMRQLMMILRQPHLRFR